MAELGTVYVDIQGDWSKFEKNTTSGFGGIAKKAAAAFAGAFVVGQVIDFGKESFAAYEEYDDLLDGVNQLTMNQAEAMGLGAGAAKEMTDSVLAQADALSALTGFSDEQILSGQKQLLTFQGVKNEGEGAAAVFDRANAALADMVAADALGDFNSGAIQMGKALENPTKGVTALSRAGVTFTDAQKEQIATLQESGDMLGAQQLILGQIEQVYGGVAASSADASDHIANGIQDVKVAFGEALFPVMQQILPVITGQLLPAISQLAPVFGLVAEAVGALLPSIASLIEVLVPLLVDIITPLIPVIQQVAEVFIALATPILELLGAALGPLVEILAEVAGMLLDALSPALDAIRPLFDALLPIVELLFVLLEPFLPLIEMLAELVGAILGAALGLAAEALGVLFEILAPVIEAVADFAEELVSGLGEVLPSITEWFGKLPTLITDLVSDAATWLYNVGKDVIDGLVQGITDFAGRVGDAISRVVSNISKAAKDLLGIGSPSKVMADIGVDTSLGLAEGIVSGYGAVENAVRGLLPTVPALGLDAYGTSTPVSGPLSMTFNAPVGGDMGLFADQVAAAQARQMRYVLG